MKKLIFTVFICATALAAKIEAPLPEAIVRAKTVFIVNHTGKQRVADGAYEELQKWGRLQVVTKKDASDIAVVFTERGADPPSLIMEVFSSGSEDAAYQVTTRWPTGGGKEGLLIHDGAAKHCVDEFRKRLER